MPELQRAVAAEGYLTPTPIQEQCIKHLLDGRDLLGSAQTGTGKTAAFTLPMLQRLSGEQSQPRKGSPRALILAPTRELAAQIGESIQTYGRYLHLTHTVIFGGVSQHHQVKALSRGVDILVATPGRLLDLMQQGYIHLEKVQVFVLDEVDRMLDMGFIPDIKRVLAKIPEKRQTLFFSATMAPKMVELANTMVRNPERVTITPDKPAVERIEQKVLFVSKKDKDALLVSLLSSPKIKKAIIFTQMKHVANRVVEKLTDSDIRGTAIHGNKSQVARTKALDGFKRGRFRVLVAT
ncbi:MAG: DEAD/DEAH box helicase, partial [Verrucomicrobia bacterium]|nr:DEAD/DEAH box helicase [Verrucomicrobiota bacterium]